MSVSTKCRERDSKKQVLLFPALLLPRHDAGRESAHGLGFKRYRDDDTKWYAKWTDGAREIDQKFPLQHLDVPIMGN